MGIVNMSDDVREAAEAVSKMFKLSELLTNAHRP